MPLSEHTCVFPAGPLRPCECGKTYFQGRADAAFEGACAALAEAYPLPAVQFLAGFADGLTHAIDRRYFDLVLETGENAVVYRDGETGMWFSQRA